MIVLILELTCDTCGKKETDKGPIEEVARRWPSQWFEDAKGVKATCPECLEKEIITLGKRIIEEVDTMLLPIQRDKDE